ARHVADRPRHRCRGGGAAAARPGGGGRSAVLTAHHPLPDAGVLHVSGRPQLVVELRRLAPCAPPARGQRRHRAQRQPALSAGTSADVAAHSPSAAPQPFSALPTAITSSLISTW